MTSRMKNEVSAITAITFIIITMVLTPTNTVSLGMHSSIKAVTVSRKIMLFLLLELSLFLYCFTIVLLGRK